MHFTIITPSFNQLDYLRRCIASVADHATEGVGRWAPGVRENPDLKLNTANLKHRHEPITVHHHVQDGASVDGTREFLEKLAEVDRSSLIVDGGMENLSNQESAAYQLSFASEADNGMYDALNRGIQRMLNSRMPDDRDQRSDTPCIRHQAPGAREPNNYQPSTINSSNQVVAWLNCDEQYLPGTLQAVADYFAKHPDVDVLCGHALVVDEAGGLTGFWKSMPLRRRYVQSGYLYNLSCAMFFRAGVFKQGLRFNTEYKALGDQEFMIRLLDRGIRTAVLSTFLSAYTFMPGNLSEQRFARVEREGLLNQFWGGSRGLRLFWRTAQRAERFLRGCRYQRFPLAYAIYGSESTGRSVFKSHKVSVCWPGERK